MQLPSPIQQITYQDSTIFIKRDDLIDPFISGNKWRKLKYILAEVQQQQKQHLVTFGGAYSNHLLATAAAAAKFKLKATAFVRGEEVSNPMLLLCKMYGMNLRFVNRELYRHKQILFDQHFGSDSAAYFIDEGGASTAATLGCAEIISELPEHFDHIFCAAGTGTTAAGLLNGIHQQRLKTELHVVPVLKGGEFMEDELSRFTVHLQHLQLHTNYHFGGYAKTTDELLRFVKDFSAKTGILLDPIYTGKMCYAIFDLLAKNKLPANSKILALHTGGLFGILGKMDAFSKIL
jgi:1-aminocyclopropane-1-carboxylate deaminase